MKIKSTARMEGKRQGVRRVVSAIVKAQTTMGQMSKSCTFFIAMLEDLFKALIDPAWTQKHNEERCRRGESDDNIENKLMNRLKRTESNDNIENKFSIDKTEMLDLLWTPTTVASRDQSMAARDDASGKKASSSF